MSRKRNLFVVGCTPLMMLAMMWVCAGLWAEQKPVEETKPATPQETTAPVKSAEPANTQTQAEATESPASEEKEPAPAGGEAPAENPAKAEPAAVEIAVSSEPNEPAPAGLNLEVKTDEPVSPQLEKTGKYWLRQYHPQTTQRVFAILNYPYYPGGVAFTPEPDYGAAEAKDSEQPGQAPSEVHSGNNGGQEAAKSSDAAEKASPPAAPSEATIAVDDNSPPPDGERYGYNLKKFIDLIYQWRQVNESEGTVLEIIRSVELTKTSTYIYRQNASLAIQVKRTVGHIGVTNGRFNETQQQAMEQMAQGRCDRAMVSRLEKLLADLKSQLDILADQNDQIGIALGVGKFQRVPPWGEYARQIDYSHLGPPAMELPLSVKK
jgi:hypothetical protein